MRDISTSATSRVGLVKAVIVAALVTFALAGCSPQKTAWKTAQKRNTVKAYQRFVQQFPDSPHAKQAKQHIARLKNTQTVSWASAAWRQAQKKDSLAAYRQFVTKYPHSQFTQNASQRIKQLMEKHAWQRVKKNASPSALKAFIENHPQSPWINQARHKLTQLQAGNNSQPRTSEETSESSVHKKTPKAATQSPTPQKIVDGYRVQFAAMSTRKDAVALRKKLTKKLGDVLGGVVIFVTSPGKKGTLFKIQSSTLSSEQAHALCAVVKEQKQSCFVTAHHATTTHTP